MGVSCRLRNCSKHLTRHRHIHALRRVSSACMSTACTRCTEVAKPVLEPQCTNPRIDISEGHPSAQTEFTRNTSTIEYGNSPAECIPGSAGDRSFADHLLASLGEGVAGLKCDRAKCRTLLPQLQERVRLQLPVACRCCTLKVCTATGVPANPYM